MSMEDQLGTGTIEETILVALVKKLMARNVLSGDDVRAVLLEAATNLNQLGEVQTPEAAQRMVDEDLAPLFFGKP